MSAGRLGELLDEAIGPAPSLDVREISHRLVRRRRRRAAVRGVLAIGVLALLALPVGRVVDGQRPQVRFAAVADLAPFDPTTHVADGAPLLDPAEQAHEPQRLPEGAIRCAGPTRTGASTVTTYCLAGGGRIELTRGPHRELPEVGEEIAVAGRTGYVDGAVVTVSDADSMDDTHHRLDGAGHMGPAEMVAVLESIPAIGSNPAATGIASDG